MTRRGKTPRLPAVERAAAALGAATLAAMVGFMLWAGVREGSAPPRLVPRVDGVAQVDGGWRVDVVVANRGDATAAAVHLSGAVAGPGGEERSTAVIDYVAQRSERRGALYFSRDPGAGLALRIESHVEP